VVQRSITEKRKHHRNTGPRPRICDTGTGELTVGEKGKPEGGKKRGRKEKKRRGAKSGKKSGECYASKKNGGYLASEGEKHVRERFRSSRKWNQEV